MSMTESFHSFDEWSQLVEVVIGSPSDYLFHHLDESFFLFFYENLAPMLKDRKGPFCLDDFQTQRNKYFPISRRIREELEEDIEELSSVLTSSGVVVLRPSKLSKTMTEDIVTPYWSTRATGPLNVRDQAIVLGDTLVETAPHVRARLFENDLLKPIFYRYLEAGSRWVCMPRPTLSSGALDSSYFEGRYEEFECSDFEKDGVFIEGLGTEIVFDGAQCLRFGRDVLVNVANRNHSAGFRWLERCFGDRFRFHRLDGMADNHIDSIVLPLRPGLLLIRSREYVDYLPKELKSWDLLVAPEPMSEPFRSADDQETVYLASKYIDMNVLSISESLVVANSLYPELILDLEKKGIDVIPVRHRHRRSFSGGFHCLSLDCVRKGGYETYW